ncbi:MAG: ABC transporter permease [Thermoproteota archaeon]
MAVSTFILRRFLMSIFVLIGVTTLTFLISRVVVPNPARAWIGPKPNPDLLKALMKKYHFDEPIYMQYFYYVLGLFTGDWGIDPYSSIPILTEIGMYLPVTIELTVLGLIFSMLIGVPLGVLSATHRGKTWDNVVRLSYLISTSVPIFVVALIVLLVLGYWLKIFPTSGQLSLNVARPPTITGLIMIDALLTGNINAFFDNLYHMLLPSFTLALSSFGIITRLVRSSMIEVLEMEYIKTAKIKGLDQNKVFYKHSLRNALIPTVTIFALLTAWFLGGSLFIENIFSLPGMGRYTTQALLMFNIPAIMGTTFLFTLIIVMMNFIADVLYAFLDPRITLE